jgi:cytochrome c peroxidase
LAFSDNTSLSVGIDGNLGPRNAMPLINLAFIPNGLNWDGSSSTLEEQAIIPVESEVELHGNWTDIELRLKRHTLYPEWFRNAFDIETKGEITDELARKALSQFVRSLVSATSKWDASLGYDPPNNPFLTDAEQRGRTLFLSELSDDTDKECAHCHGGGGRLFTNNDFINNGLTAAPTMTEFPDLGFGNVTGNIADNGKFRTPTLRNIELTGPYMHDGSIETLEEVLDHYADHLQDAPNLDGILAARLTGTNISFTQQEKDDLIAYMKALTDTKFITNPAYSNPW